MMGPPLIGPIPGKPGIGDAGARGRGMTCPSHSGGAGAPPGGITTSCEELADGRVKSPGQEARPGADKTPRWSAERRPCPPKGDAAKRLR